MLRIFSTDAAKNIISTGNVWGQTIEYDFKFKIRIWRRIFQFEQRNGNQAWGRFGGGWSVKLGIQASSLRSLFLLKDVIINLFTMTIRVSVAP